LEFRDPGQALGGTDSWGLAENLKRSDGALGGWHCTGPLLSAKGQADP
jgi:hypothetical protein